MGSSDESDCLKMKKERKKERKRQERAKLGEDFRSVDGENCSTINKIVLL